MKINTLPRFKTILSVLLLLMIGSNANAQLSKKLERKPRPAGQESKIKPAITSPTAGSEITGPFVMVGRAAPNTYINLYVTPIYTVPGNGTGKPTLLVSTPNHQRQEFNIKADEKGIWKSPVIEVLFDEQTTNRRIFAFVSQTWGAERYESKNIEYRASPKLVLSKKVIKIPAKD